MLTFDKIVEKMWKKWWKVMFKKDIYEIIDPECKKQYESYVNKAIYRLKAGWHIISLKSWVYIVPHEDDTKLNAIDLLEKYYIKLLKKYIVWEVWSAYYISGVKSLGFHMKDYSVPMKIYIMNRSVNKKIKVGEYEIIFKTIHGKEQGKKINLYSKFQKFTKEIELEWIILKHSCLELAILESALVSDIYEWLDMSKLVQVLKKYARVLDEDVFREIWRYKYNMSFNRLKEIAKPMNSELYEVFLDVIKQNWWCFVWEGLRAM